MHNSLTAIDHLKISWLIEESLQKLNFLSKVNKDDNASSELAGYEINKLLSEQSRLEEKYAELLKIRSTLKGISDKRKLEDTQKEIQELAHSLKENTRKLGRLFRENPSFEKDREKINNEKAELLEKLENIVTASYQNFSLINLQSGLIDELEAQDFLRKQILKEKNLVQEIKELHAVWKKEEEDLQTITLEKQALTQRQKENLATAKATASMENNYKEKEIYALEGTHGRIQNMNLTNIQNQIEETQEKRDMELQAFAKISSFLRRQEEQNKARIQEWNAKLEESRVSLTEKVENLNEIKAKQLAKLEKLKAEFEIADGKRKEKEKKYLEKEEAKAKRAEDEVKLEEAIQNIQEKYMAWKETGGAVKKPKKPKKKAGKD